MAAVDPAESTSTGSSEFAKTKPQILRADGDQSFGARWAPGGGRTGSVSRRLRIRMDRDRFAGTQNADRPHRSRLAVRSPLLILNQYTRYRCLGRAVREDRMVIFDRSHRSRGTHKHVPEESTPSATTVFIIVFIFGLEITSTI